MSFALAFLEHPAPVLVDEDGRPVAEVGSEVEGSAVTERVACPYADRRAGLPMNGSALRQLGAVWPAVLGAVRAAAGPPPVTVRGAFHAAVVGTAGPVRWWVDAAGRPVPRAIAATYKTSLGLSQVFAAACLADPELGDAPLASLGGPDAFFAFLDDGGWLLGQVEACAGPRGWIEEVFAALCAGGGPQPAWAGEATAAVGLLGAALLAAPRPDPSAPRLARLHGPKGPSWARALAGAPGRTPADAARWFAGSDPHRARVTAFADAIAGREPAAVEAATARALRALSPTP